MAQYWGNTGGPSGASLISKAILDPINQKLQQDQQNKMAIAKMMIQNGQYQPVLGGPQPNMAQKLFGGAPTLGQPTMNMGGQNFQYQDPATKMANLKAQLAAIQGAGGQPSLGVAQGSVSGLPSSLPDYQITPKIDPNTMTATPDITASTPLQRAEYQDKLLDIKSKKTRNDQVDAQENQDATDNAMMKLSPDDLKSQMKTKNTSMYNLGESVHKGDMTFNNIPSYGKNTQFKQKFDQYMASAYPDENFGLRNQTSKEFSLNGKTGQNAGNYNTAINHLYEMYKTIPEIKNMELAGGEWKPLNRLTQSSSRYFGPGSSTLKKFDTLKSQVSTEMANAAKRNGATDPEIQKAENNIDSADTPESMQEGLQEYIKLLGGKIMQNVNGWDSVFNKPGDPKLPTNILPTSSKYVLRKIGMGDIIKQIESPTGKMGKEDNSEDSPSASQHTVGQVIPINGKKYKVVGGDPSDPDIEEVK